MIDQTPVTLSHNLAHLYFHFSLSSLFIVSSSLSLFPFFLLSPFPCSPCFIFSPRYTTFILSLSLALPFLYHKHFQCWHTREYSHPENRATTIMSMLSSHNNTRITCWGRQALLGAGLTDQASLDCQHHTDLHLLKCEIWS